MLLKVNAPPPAAVDHDAPQPPTAAIVLVACSFLFATNVHALAASPSNPNTVILWKHLGRTSSPIPIKGELQAIPRDPVHE